MEHLLELLDGHVEGDSEADVVDENVMRSRYFTRMLSAVLSVPDLHVHPDDATKLILKLLPHAYHPLIGMLKKFDLTSMF